jgi:hypothetical protein
MGRLDLPTPRRPGWLLYANVTISQVAVQEACAFRLCVHIELHAGTAIGCCYRLLRIAEGSLSLFAHSLFYPVRACVYAYALLSLGLSSSKQALCQSGDHRRDILFEIRDVHNTLESQHSLDLTYFPRRLLIMSIRKIRLFARR